MSKPTDKRKCAHKGKRKGLQFNLDQELEGKARAEVMQNPPSKNEDSNPRGGEGILTIFNNNYESIQEREPLPSPPPNNKRKKVCLYGDPANRETIRRKLTELGVTNANQLIRNYTAAELLEAIMDYEQALDDGFRVWSPTAYFRSLLL